VAACPPLNPAQEYVFSSWGLISGTIIEVQTFQYISVGYPMLGIAVCSGIAAAMNVVTSMIIAEGIFDATMVNEDLAICGVLLVIAGLAGVVAVGK
jgi:hypothetical protein